MDIRFYIYVGWVGVWVVFGLGLSWLEEKIVVIGVCLCKWVLFYGVSINVSLNFEYFFGIVFCGLFGYGVISFEKLGKDLF